MKSPADTSSAIESAICAVASDVRNRAAARAPDGWPLWPFSVDTRSGRVLCSAGKRPKSSPVAIERIAAKASAVPSSSNAMFCVVSSGSSDARKVSVHCATTSPATPPSAASSIDSVRSWRTTWPRLAPIDSRTAISVDRFAARASRRLAMFAHAISRTTPVTASSSSSGGRASSCMLLCPRAPGSTRSSFARNRAIVWSLIPFWSGASTSLTIPR